MSTDELDIDFFNGNKAEFNSAVKNIEFVSNQVERLLDKYEISIMKRENFGYANWMGDHYLWSLITEITSNVKGQRIEQNSRGISIKYYPNPQKAFEEEPELQERFFESSQIPRDFFVIEADNEDGKEIQSTLVKNKTELIKVLAKLLCDLSELIKKTG